jgi:1,2-dihydroxy-3-keto-5-methylthiopentene dioxygenase
MSRLTVTPDHDPRTVLFDSRDGMAIASELGRVGVRFERWSPQAPLPDDAADADVLEAYRADIDRLTASDGYQSVDVIRVLPDNPQKDALRAKFLAEHTHADDEVRFFVEGAGLFYLRIGGRVYMTLCEAGDLISVPSGTTHWFDMGDAPRFAAIRLFTTPDGWVAQFTGDDIATRFPDFQQAQDLAAKAYVQA